MKIRQSLLFLPLSKALCNIGKIYVQNIGKIGKNKEKSDDNPEKLVIFY